MGPLIAAALLASVLIGLAWRPGLAITLLGLVIVALGILSRLNVPAVAELDSITAVLGVGSNPPVIAGLFIIGFGRLISFAQAIAARKPATSKADERPAAGRREPSLRHDDRG